MSAAQNVIPILMKNIGKFYLFMRKGRLTKNKIYMAGKKARRDGGALRPASRRKIHPS